ncbi:MAG TPA: HoxN/HupN/NixA family nickel/cobalt transporter [Acidobacteriaceae bacterium]|nr:HoxN/HupN/NixA family nickel/cobalt transporter [Acidobacteriaceae bacterium]
MGEGRGTRRRATVVLTALAAANLAVWGWAAVAFHEHGTLLGTALLAYCLGLRHAVDADHIAAIDNVTRKLMQQGKRPVGVGLMFSLGHSTVVVAGSMAMAGAALGLEHRLETVRAIGAVIGTAVSSGFLFVIGIVNLMVLRSVYRAFVRVRRGGEYVEEDMDLLLGDRGLLTRIFRPVFRMIGKSWHMYPLGLLFGLGFDTATEVGLLGIAAAEASKGLPMAAILVFPALFAAGMSLIDTADNLLMLGAYGWAGVKPVRKLYYNLTITAMSAGAAITVGAIEALGLVAERMRDRGAFWDGVYALNANFALIGYAIVTMFALSWAVSIAIYKWRRFDLAEPERPKS